MFAQTGLTHRVALEKVMRLQALVHNACELFCDELRRVQDFDLLLSALQAFKENRLAGVLQKRQGQLSSQQLMEAMSLEIANTTLTQEDKRYLHKRGIRYVGELLYVFFDPRGKGTRELGDRILGEIRGNLNLPNDFDPLHEGWRPPYWDDPSFYKAINLSPLANFGNLVDRDLCGYRRGNPKYRTVARVLHYGSIHSMGQFLKDGGRLFGDRNWGVGRLARRHALLNLGKADLWAGALIPPDWQAPDQAPADWLADPELATAELEYSDWKKKREAAREATRRAAPLGSVRWRGLDLSIRAINALENVGIVTLEDLTKLSMDDLLNRGLGRSILRELVHRLAKAGLSLRQ